MKKRKTIISLLSTVAALAIITGCSGKSYEPQSVSLSPQEAAELKQALLKKLRSDFSPQSQETAAPVQKTGNDNIPIVSEEELKAKVEKLPLSTTGVKFTKRRDGFMINDTNAYIDPEGAIVNYGYDWKNGTFSYMIETAPGHYKIKYNTAENKNDAVEIATVKRSGNKYFVTTASGKKLSGKGLILTSKGFIVIRDATAFTYNAGEGVYNFIAPKGWHIASFQNGDVASTHFMLLERDQKASSGSRLNPFADLLKSTQELGNALGVMQKNDYMLISLNNPKQRHMLNITLGEKDVALYSECRNTSRYYQKCDQMDMRESLYQPNGLKNFNHYYWNVTWFSGKDKVFAVTKESNNRNVNVIDLESGKKVTMASRVTGFPEFEAVQDNTGTVKVHVAGGFLPSVDISSAEGKLDDKKTKIASKK